MYKKRKFNCFLCKKTFFSSNGPKMKFCSKKCGYVSITKHFEKNCPTCGIIFKSKSIYCSNKCRGISTRGIEKKYIVKIHQLTEEQLFDRLKESFNSNIIRKNGCWNFLGKLRSDGYGAIVYKGKRILIHRASWIIHHGNLPKNMYVLHKCDNRQCSNPSHLFLGTQKENIYDMVSKRRNYVGFGEKINQSKLKTEQVIQIKKLLAQKKSIKEISELFRISYCAISDIKRNKTWKHISIAEDQL